MTLWVTWLQGKASPCAFVSQLRCTCSGDGGIPCARHLQQPRVILNPGVAAGGARGFPLSLIFVLGRSQACFGRAEGHRALLLGGWCEMWLRRWKRRRKAELLAEQLSWPAPSQAHGSATAAPSRVSYFGVRGMWKKVNKTHDGVKKKKDWLGL